MSKKIDYNVLIEDATSLREIAFEFAENKISGKEYLLFLKKYNKLYYKEGYKLFDKGIKRARTRLRSYLSRHYGKDSLDLGCE